MIVTKKRTFYAFLICVMYLFCVIDMGTSENKIANNMRKLSINLKTRTLVLGPDITLGDVSRILTPNNTIRAKLLKIKIGNAPPPGESSEIKLSYIKRCLKMKGFNDYIGALHGPRTIRVITAPVEIDKAILKEEFAKSITNIALLASFEA